MEKKMNLGTISLVLGSLAALFTILAYLYKGVRFNKARSKAQQGRIVSLFRIQQIQGQRLTRAEKHISKKDEGYPIDDGLVQLEEEAMNEYKEHDTKLT
jgi:hypothetical protein